VGPYTIEKIKLNINYYNIKPKDILWIQANKGCGYANKKIKKNNELAKIKEFKRSIRLYEV